MAKRNTITLRTIVCPSCEKRCPQGDPICACGLKFNARSRFDSEFETLGSLDPLHAEAQRCFETIICESAYGLPIDDQDEAGWNVYEGLNGELTLDSDNLVARLHADMGAERPLNAVQWRDWVNSELNLNIASSEPMNNLMADRIGKVIRRKIMSARWPIVGEKAAPLSAVTAVFVVTIKDVAKAVGNSKNSMTNYVKKWGTPVVVDRGRRPAKYDIKKLLPILATQFPDVHQSRWDLLKSLAMQF